VGFELDRRDPHIVMQGLECLLKEEGNRKPGLNFSPAAGSVSQTIPVPKAEVSALYYISYLFYGSFDFADVVALTRISAGPEPPNERIVFNSKEDVQRAYKSYRKWFETIKSIGLDEARKQRLDPLAGSDVEWYLQRFPLPKP
jgi:hypothetical protein